MGDRQEEQELFLCCRTRSEAETEELGAALGRLVEAGTWIALDGALGSGKTVLARGLLAGLGYEGRVRSPTYGLLQAYEQGETRLPAYHVDLYRLQDAGEIWSLGLADLLEEGVVVIIEWAQRLGGGLPTHRLHICVEFCEEPDHRRLELAAQGQARVLLERLVRDGAVTRC